MEKKEIVKSLASPVRFAAAVTFSPDGKYVTAVFMDETVITWRLSDEQIGKQDEARFLLYEMGNGAAEDVGYTPDGKYIVFGDLTNVRVAENPFYGK